MTAAGLLDATGGAWGVADVDPLITTLYAAHYRSLVRLAAFLTGDVGAAEEVVQDAFTALHGSWSRLRNPDNAPAYLRQAVVNRSRSTLRHRTVVERHPPEPPQDAPSAETGALGALERERLLAALRTLPARQREALVLRYYGGLSEAEIATAMGVSRGSVKTHTSRGITALRTMLERVG
jgi:RNA polymerase sigma-70 factor (sigma-E family)